MDDHDVVVFTYLELETNVKIIRQKAEHFSERDFYILVTRWVRHVELGHFGEASRGSASLPEEGDSHSPTAYQIGFGVRRNSSKAKTGLPINGHHTLSVPRMIEKKPGNARRKDIIPKAVDNPLEISQVSCYARLDAYTPWGIIKDVMRPQSEEGKTAQKRRIRGSSSADSPRARNLEADVLTDTSIDPADFFDPEEFGYRRKPKLPGE
jgi:hypothetical protein